MQKKGVTRKVFLWGSIVLGCLTLMLGISMFLDHIPNEKMQTLSNFIPFAFATLGATKVGGRIAEAREESGKSN